MPKPAPRDCPCHAGRRYRECCAPYHRREAEAPDPTALMRSRYAAFALGELEYLWDTLDELHADRAAGREAALRELRDGHGALKYMGLEVLDAAHEATGGQVLFLARIFEKGRDRSFVERSTFRHDGRGYRYLEGHSAPLARVKAPPSDLRLANFEASLVP